MPSPGPDFSFRPSGHFLPLTHLSGGQHTPCRSVWVSLEASAGLTSVQPWEMQGWMGVSGCAGMSWESSQKSSTEFCSRAECWAASARGGLAYFSSKCPCCSPELPLLSFQTAPYFPVQFIPCGYDACKHPRFQNKFLKKRNVSIWLCSDASQQHKR